jgi:hypothetical protein
MVIAGILIPVTYALLQADNNSTDTLKQCGEMVTAFKTLLAF